MTIITATQSNATVTPRKLRLIAYAVKDLQPQVAIQQLTYLNKEGARVLVKVMKQAVANAKNNAHLNPDSLIIKEIVINKGRVYKRGRAAARGRSKPYRHVHSHVTVKLTTPATPAAPVKEVKATPVKAVKPAVKKATTPAVKKAAPKAAPKTAAKKTTTATKKVTKKATTK